jgi:hypothetical protein
MKGDRGRFPRFTSAIKFSLTDQRFGVARLAVPVAFYHLER